MAKWLAGFVVLIVAVIAACSGSVGDNGPLGCGGNAPGVIALVPGIVVQVRDPFGVAQAIGTTIVAHKSDGTDASFVVEDTLNINTAYNTVGTFTVTVTRPYYHDETITNVSVTPSGCVVHTTKVPVSLSLAAGAPALRAIAVVGGDFLDHAGAQATLLAHFDADPAVSRTVTWQVSDAKLASIDASGVLTAKCATSGGTVKVTATSTVDASITSSINIGVAPTAACP